MVGARVLKCFLLPSSTLSKNTFSSEGNGRDFLTSSTSSRLSSKSCPCKSVRDGLTMMCRCWTDRLTWIFCIGNLRSLGEIIDCRQIHDQPSIFVAPWAERLHYRPPPIGALLTLWSSGNVEETSAIVELWLGIRKALQSQNLKGFVVPLELQTPFHCVSMSAVCRHVGFRPRPSVLAPIDPPLLPPS